MHEFLIKIRPHIPFYSTPVTPRLNWQWWYVKRRLVLGILLLLPSQNGFAESEILPTQKIVLVATSATLDAYKNANRLPEGRTVERQVPPTDSRVLDSIRCFIWISNRNRDRAQVNCPEEALEEMVRAAASAMEFGDSATAEQLLNEATSAFSCSNHVIYRNTLIKWLWNETRASWERRIDQRTEQLLPDPIIVTGHSDFARLLTIEPGFVPPESWNPTDEILKEMALIEQRKSQQDKILVRFNLNDYVGYELYIDGEHIAEAKERYYRAGSHYIQMTTQDGQVKWSGIETLEANVSTTDQPFRVWPPEHLRLPSSERAYELLEEAVRLPQGGRINMGSTIQVDADTISKVAAKQFIDIENDSVLFLMPEGEPILIIYRARVSRNDEVRRQDPWKTPGPLIQVEPRFFPLAKGMIFTATITSLFYGSAYAFTLRNQFSDNNSENIFHKSVYSATFISVLSGMIVSKVNDHRLADE